MIYEDSFLSLDVPEKGAVEGHLALALKSQTPEDLGVAGVLSNVLAAVLFERLGAQGSNILMQYGRGSVDVLARREGDGLDVRWDPQEIAPEEIRRVHSLLKDKMFLPEGGGESEAKAPPEPEQTAPQQGGEDDYLVKQLHRVP